MNPETLDAILDAGKAEILHGKPYKLLKPDKQMADEIEKKARRTRFEMTWGDIAEATIPGDKPHFQGLIPLSTWQNLGEKLGFDYGTVQRVPGKNIRFFTAEKLEKETRNES